MLHYIKSKCIFKLYACCYIFLNRSYYLIFFSVGNYESPDQEIFRYIHTSRSRNLNRLYSFKWWGIFITRSWLNVNSTVTCVSCVSSQTLHLYLYSSHLISSIETEWEGIAWLISDTRNIRDAVVPKLFAAAQQAAVRHWGLSWMYWCLYNVRRILHICHRTGTSVRARVT